MPQPTEKQYRANDRVSFAVLEAGAGEPLVFVHGAGGLFWDPYLDALAEHRKVYAPFLPGSGASTGIEDIRDLWDLVLCYYDLFDALGLGRVDVIGHSLGGMIASELAATDPSRVRRLVALAPAGTWHDDEPMADIFAMTPDELLQRMAADPTSPVAQALMYMPEDLDAQVELVIQRIATLQSAAKFLWPIPDKGLTRRMHRIKAPTLVLWGKQDGLIPVSYAQDFQRGIAGCKVELLDGASHLLQIERLDACVELTRSFLSGEDVPPVA
jgi:pimeloyl-ACP methyl ester carboxylesterase